MAETSQNDTMIFVIQVFPVNGNVKRPVTLITLQLQKYNNLNLSIMTKLLVQNFIALSVEKNKINF